MSARSQPEYRTLSANALRLIVEEPWLGCAPDSTHERRFALAELERRADAFEAPDLLRVDRDSWRDQFQAAEKTARELDAHWQTLAEITGIDEENDTPWPAVVERVRQMRNQLVALAKLACPTPQFFNPLDIWETQQLRDRVLADAGVEVLK